MVVSSNVQSYQLEFNVTEDDTGLLIINGITYQDTNLDNPTAGNRVFTLTQVQDNGGTANGGSDTTTLYVTPVGDQT